jgi:MFS family permease
METIKKNLGYGWVVWFVAALFYAIEFFQRVAPSVLAEPISQAFNISPITLGFIISSYFYVYGLAQIPVGLMLDRYQARWMLGGAAFVVSLGTLLFASVHHIWALVIGRILIGLGSAFGFIGCLKLAREWFSNSMFALIVGLTNTIGVLGGLFGQEPLALLNKHYGWQHSLMFTVAAGLIVSLLIVIFVRNNREGCCGRSRMYLPVGESIRTIFSSRQAWLIAIYAGLMVAPVIAFAELWSVDYFVKTQHLSASLAAQASSIIFIGIGVGGPVNGLISNFIGSRKIVMGYGNIMTLALFLAIIFIPILPHLYLDLIMFGFGFFVSAMLVAFSLNTESHSARLSATVLAWTNMAISIVGAVFQPLIGYILQHIGHIKSLAQATGHDFRMTMMILPVALAINLIVLYFIRESNCKSMVAE